VKIVHAADLHIDSPMVGIERYEGLPVDRLRSATREAFRNLVTMTLDERAEMLLLAGDLFDDAWRDYATGLFFLNELSRLRETGAKVVIVRGNHDAQNKVTKNLTLPAHVIELGAKRPETRVFEDIGIAVHGQSYADRETKDDIAAKYPVPISGLFNVGLLHTSLDGRPGHASYAPTTLSTLAAKGYDYWALGHVHAREIVSREPYVVFPGNLQGRSVRETGDKGATIITVKNGRIAEVEHRALDVVRWHVLDVDASAIENADTDAALAMVTRVLADAARSLDSRLGVARVVVHANETLFAKLLSDEEAFIAEVRNQANDAGDDALSIERVVLKTAQRTADERTVVAGADVKNDDAGSDVDDAFIARVRSRLQHLALKMPDASKKLLSLEDDDKLRELARDAQALVARAMREDEP
jgi:DNA repair exonuclease SbcCD nuclease subunit